MRNYSIHTLIRAIGLTLAVLLWSGDSVRAQNIYSWSTTGSPPSVSISFNGGSGGTTAGSFTIQQYSSSFPYGATGSTFQAFCVDLWHTQQTGNTTGNSHYNGDGNVFAANTVTSGFASVVSTEAGVHAPTNAGDPTLTKELTYLGYVYQHASGSDQVGAVQLAIWHVIDNSFAVTNYHGDTTLQTDYGNIGTLLSGGTVSSGFGSGLVAFSSGDTITGTADILQINSQNSSSDQNLLTWGTITVTAGAPSAPEPSTLAIAGLGALAFIGYGMRRRKAQGA